MARIRTIKPEFWAHEDLSSLPEATHMLAAALLNYADDEGYFNARPELIKAACFPLREPSVTIHGSLSELSRIGYVRLGVGSDGKHYGHIVKFLDHQKVSHAKPSHIKTFNISWGPSVTIHGSFSESSGNSVEASVSPPEMRRPELNRIELNRIEKNSRACENESENEDTPKPSDFDPLKAQNEAKRLAKLYVERTKCPHSNAGCEGAIYALLNAQIASTSILEAAIAGYAEDPNRKNADSKYTLSGRKFFGEGGWEGYKDGKAHAPIDDDPQNLRKATAKLLAEKAERRRQIELERPEVERQDAEFLKTYGVPRTFFNRGMAHAGKLKTLDEIAAEAEQKAQGGAA